MVTGASCAETEVPRFGIDTEDHPDGVRVVSVGGDSGAAAAGITEGDVIVSVDGVPITDPPSLTETKAGHAVGDTVTVVVLRDGSEIELAVTLGGREDWFCGVLMATSADGSAWRQLEAPVTAAGDAWFGWVTEWAGGLASLVETCDVDYNCEQFLFTAADGVSWQQVPLGDAFGEAMIFGLHPFGEGFLATGSVLRREHG